MWRSQMLTHLHCSNLNNKLTHCQVTKSSAFHI
jgi:hypothetical protein